MNRDRPQLYILYVRERLSGFSAKCGFTYWLGKLREYGGYLSEYTPLYPIDSVEEIDRNFSSGFYLRGFMGYESARDGKRRFNHRGRRRVAASPVRPGAGFPLHAAGRQWPAHPDWEAPAG